jgi:hypothetical protein
MEKLLSVSKDIWRNFRVPILLGALGVLVLTTYVYEFEYIWQYYLCVAICSAGGISCIIYGIKKML